MARRRYRRQIDTRKHRKRVKPPTDGWLLTEFCALLGTSPHTVRSYMRAGLLSRPTFRGRATRYQRTHAIRFLAIKLLRLDNAKLSQDALRAYLERFNPAELEAWVLARPIAERVRTALARGGPLASVPPAAIVAGVNAPSMNGLSANAPSANASHANPHAAVGSSAAEPEWQRATLLPGLELALSADAHPAARRAFAHLQAQFGVWLDQVTR